MQYFKPNFQSQMEKVKAQLEAITDRGFQPSTAYEHIEASDLGPMSILGYK